MISTIIIEDQKMKSDELSSLLEQYFPEIELLKICSTFKQGVAEVIALKPQLLFLDVELDGGYTGFDLLEQTRSVNYKVIFTTSFNQYAVRAFRFSAIDYIQGLYGFEQLNEAIGRYKAISAIEARDSITTLLHNAMYTNNILLQKIGIPVMGGLDFINISEIIYCKAINTCTEFHLTKKRKIVATKTLKWVNSELEDDNFFRTHDSYFINLEHLITFRKDGEGGIVELSDNVAVPVSRRRKDELLKVLSRRKRPS